MGGLQGLSWRPPTVGGSPPAERAGGAAAGRPELPECPGGVPVPRGRRRRLPGVAGTIEEDANDRPGRCHSDVFQVCHSTATCSDRHSPISPTAMQMTRPRITRRSPTSRPRNSPRSLTPGTPHAPVIGRGTHPALGVSEPDSRHCRTEDRRPVPVHRGCRPAAPGRHCPPCGYCAGIARAHTDAGLVDSTAENSVQGPRCRDLECPAHKVDPRPLCRRMEAGRLSAAYKYSPEVSDCAREGESLRPGSTVNLAAVLLSSTPAILSPRPDGDCRQERLPTGSALASPRW